MKRVYLDNASTTPLDGEVLEAMLPFLRDQYGNPSSVHAMGRKARYAIEDSRERVARVLECEPSEIIFTSGGTEADNLAVHCLEPGPIASSPAEHKAVLTPLEDHSVRWLPVDSSARVDADSRILDAVQAATVMLVNNETGAVNDVALIADRLHQHDGVLHVDAVQAAGLLDIRIPVVKADLMTLSAHKIGGPKGCGLLYVRAGTPYSEIIKGGSQERGRRGGTENVAGIVGFARALEKATSEKEEWNSQCRLLRRRLREGLFNLNNINFVENSTEDGAPHILNVAFPPVNRNPVDGEMLILNLDVEGVCVSSGSACTSGAVEPSHVLLAAGLAPDTAAASIRVSLGKQNTVEDVDHAVMVLGKCLDRMVEGPQSARNASV
ncbi:MAG: cysteine desulfurase [Rhodothermales bacterium]|nr:cysteine desulfurase [Rhodothermales bacterium]